MHRFRRGFGNFWFWYDIIDSESSVDYESESDRDLNYNDADILTNEQMDQIFNAESDTEFAGFE